MIDSAPNPPEAVASATAMMTLARTLFPYRVRYLRGYFLQAATGYIAAESDLEQCPRLARQRVSQPAE